MKEQNHSLSTDFKKKNIRLKPLAVSVALLPLLALAFFAIRLLSIQAGMTGSLTAFFADPAYQADLLLADFPVYGQTYANSCGVTTISMVYSYLAKPASEEDLAEKLGISLGRSGMLPDRFLGYLQSALLNYGYQVEHQVNLSDIIFLERIYAQLKQGLPVPVYFSTVNAWDKPNYDTHFSVIIGFRPQKRAVVIANAYGFTEEMPIVDLLASTKYENYPNAPLDFRLGLFFGVIDKNNLYVIQRRNPSK